jgi:lysyl-tRNA synthetase, class I
MNEVANQAKSWPFQEARRLLAHIEAKGKKPGDVVTFETGYGPSGAPHIGTFAEVVRTLWVMRAFNTLTEGAYKPRLIMFSDDYDAMRRVPDDMPEWMNEHLGKPLTHVPSPYPYEEIAEASFGQANNEKLARFVEPLLKAFDGSKLGNTAQGAKYGMVSSSEYYWGGGFDGMLNRVWDNHQAILDVMLPTLGEDRRATYSPFMPVFDGHVLQVAVTLSSTPYWITFDTVSHGVEINGLSQSIYQGNVKLQWKVDWAMRWAYFDVDYEMSGKDLIDSVKASNKICRILGGTPPLNMTYELFLDENGEKISKSKGNGFTIDDWRRYGSDGSLCLFMFQNPKAAKRLYRGLIPKLEDEYLKARSKATLTLDEPLWHFAVQLPKPLKTEMSYNLLLNLIHVTQAETSDQLVAYLAQYRDIEADVEVIRSLANGAMNYADAEGSFNRERRAPTDKERAAMLDLVSRFEAMVPGMDGEAYQYQVYEVGKAHSFEPLRDWFKALYECLLGSSDGPRFGVFTQSYGLENTIRLIKGACGVVA